ncbi:hypothetical protein TcasGA2_TC004185 [Tribolium castaneum]|uniref:Uncharacterized protein n=1 Tax=Tribolium castaneum TaxID=7070 RepID=D7EKP8_TRICA|nr:hypothetical protein TcasGA2_TC004185 [Tribolium castaneum]
MSLERKASWLNPSVEKMGLERKASWLNPSKTKKLNYSSETSASVVSEKTYKHCLLFLFQAATIYRGCVTSLDQWPTPSLPALLFHIRWLGKIVSSWVEIIT